MKKVILSILFIAIYLLGYGQLKEVLFFGNSITASGIPMHFQELAKSTGDSVFAEQHWGGQLLQEYVQDAPSIQMTSDKLSERDWDYVVLQENSQVSGFYPGWNQGYFEYYAYNASQQLNNLIREKTSCGETVFFMTYGYLEGDKLNFPEDTYEKQQDRIKRNYMLLSDSFSSMASPVGWAWKKVREEKTWGDDLYMPGDHHPSELGAYLAACVFYAVILEKSPVGNPYFGPVDPIRAAYLQSVAASVVLDSSELWNININKPDAKFEYSMNKLSVEFNSVSKSKYLEHTWYFGNGDSSNLKNPVYNYSSDGTYTVKHVVFNSCTGTQTIEKVIIIDNSGINTNVKTSINIFPQPSSDYLYIVSEESIDRRIELFDLNGKLLLQTNYSGMQIKLDCSALSSGTYVMHFVSDKSRMTKLVQIIR